MTPFLLACSRNKVEVCRLLLEAGADPRLLTPSGATALDVATAAGAAEVVDLLRQCLAVDDPNKLPRDEGPLIDEAHGVGTVAAQVLGVLELDGWEPETEPVAPPVDPRFRKEVEAAQTAITRHVPQDDSVNWDDVDVVLPDRVLLLSRSEDPESIGRLRVLLLRAIREGSVPEHLVEELARAPAGEVDWEAVRSLHVVFQDLGAECDERFEYSTSSEDFRVYIDPEESPEEEEAVGGAIAFLENLTARRNDPTRLYQRDFVRVPLLTPDEEVAYGQTMERGITQACDALARWAEGLQYLAEAVATVLAGARPIRWLRAGAADGPGAPQYGDGQDEPSAAVLIPEESLRPAVDGLAGEEAVDDPDIAPASQPHAAGELEELASLFPELKNIAATPNHDEEAALRVVRALNLARSFLVGLLEVAKSDTSEDSARFQEAMATYLQARDAMVRGNLKLAFLHARKAFSSRLDVADLAQEANLGLIRAVDKFDWRRGHRFSTYATWWIRQTVLRAVADDSRLIRLPVHVHEKVQQVRRVARSLEERSGVQPTHEEIAVRLGMSRVSVAKWLRVDQDPEPIDAVDLVGRMSIDAQENYVEADPSESVGRQEAAMLIDAALSSLKPREAQVLRMRFGLAGFEPMTLEEVGACFEFTRERARQIESKALKKLKHPSQRAALAVLVEGTEGQPD
jgi:RNA polymerase primary sigma factor